MKHEYLNVAEPDVLESRDPYVGIADETVLLASQENPALFGALVGRYQAPFLRAAMRVVRERTEAEDVVQEAFVKIYRYARRFKAGEDRKFSSWAYKIVLNTAITHYHKQRRRELPLPEEGDPTAGEAQTNFRETVLERETEALIRAALEEMPQDLALLLRAYYLEDKSYKAIAAENGVTMGALKMKLFRARKLFEKIVSSTE